MIREKRKLTGNLNVKQSLSGSLSNSVIYVEPITQEKEATPTKEIQEITPDTGYIGLSKVTVKGYTPKVTNKTITQNGIYYAEEEGLDGYDIVKVETSGVDINDYFDKYIKRGNGYSDFRDSGISKTLLKWKTPLIVNDDIGDYMFANFPFPIDMPDLEQSSKLTSANYMFYNCKGTTIKEIDTSNITSFRSFLYGCSNITEIPLLDFKNAKLIGSWAFFAQRLEKVAGLKDVGMAYENTQAENYSNYSVDFHFCTNLSEQSLINILNNLYDIKTKGCKPQQVVLGSTNLAKLTSEEGQQALSNAQAKGWTVS